MRLYHKVFIQPHDHVRRVKVAFVAFIDSFTQDAIDFFGINVWRTDQTPCCRGPAHDLTMVVDQHLGIGWQSQFFGMLDWQVGNDGVGVAGRQTISSRGISNMRHVVGVECRFNRSPRP